MAASRQEIAIIGSGCRFPGSANSPSKLWDLVRNPRQVAEPIPTSRFSARGFYHENAQYHGHMNVEEAYFLAGEGVCRHFDASFFGMNAAEANALDPQCRLLLEIIFEAIEEAGLTIEGLQGSDTAVYTGQMVSDYDTITTRDTDDSEGIYHASGTSHAMLSNRISYFFDWHGPSMTIDTACSSSLVAFHQAVEQLRLGHSRVAIAAGANLILDPSCFISLSSLNMLSPDGRSRMWDADANGYARGEGIAAVVLKTLDTALEDGDDIECIVRGTAFAQDGRTQGITMPNPAAQAQLIRDCYTRAGLDLSSPAHLPQFFECHGTGTQAGDAAEAEAIASSFFSTAAKDMGEAQENIRRLWVGSIKSIIGHTEGTAGIAGVLKASLALKNALIPPNLLFSHLNPRIKPFYTNLQVSTTATPWPAVFPRRASVNSFGFGGANVHAILESYTPAKSAHYTHSTRSIAVFTPFVFSAFSKTSLIAYLAEFRNYLRVNAANLCLRDLAYTLHSRRTCFQVTTAISAASFDDLCTKIDTKLEAAQKDTGQPAIVQLIQSRNSDPRKPLILGIFTGQGAQWAGMGSDIITNSTMAKCILERLEHRLSQLPTIDRPSWSLVEELQKNSSASRMHEASLSQPLCTAVQILQVDILRASGIEFAAVVGHSSGEIAAAYAAGFISAEVAICIAYYRGLHLKSVEGKPGAMMAVGTSFKDAQELCDAPEFKGRICVAAINSPVSLTLSGDEDAIQESKVIFDDEQKFTRILKVDKAYHSHHMLPCSIPYLKSLAALSMKINAGDRSTWFSSVFGGQNMTGNCELLSNTYWNSNMVSPVLFQQAIESVFNSKGPLDLAIEVGPHPALKGPVLQIMQDVLSQELPYTGLFRRGISAVESVADGLGYVWTHLGRNIVNLHNYDKLMAQDSTYKVVKGLPTYAWDHQKEYWNESKHAKAFRMRPDPVHELLGHRAPDSNEQDMRWRHILRPTEIPWLIGHRLQDQLVFPAAGYVVTALEAAMDMCKQKRVTASLIKLVEIGFGRALVFDHDESSVEIILCMADILHLGLETIEAKFKYFAADGKGDSSLVLMSSCRVQISLGQPCTDALPARLPKPPSLIKVREEDFYSASRDLEYQWAGSFVALEKLERKLGATTGFLKILEPSALLLQPAILDAAFQSVLLAYSFPGDGQLRTIHVPGRIQRISVNPSLCAREMAKGEPLPVDSSHHPDTETMFGHTDIYPSGDLDNAIIQVEGLECVPLSRATTRDDKEAFATIVWDVASPDAQIVTHDSFFTQEQHELARHLERMAGFYLRALQRNIPTDHPSRVRGNYTNFLQFASQKISLARAGHISSWNTEWENDTYEQLTLACEPFAYIVDMQSLRTIGENLTGIVKDDKHITEIGIDDSILTHFYTNALGPKFYNRYLARVMKQLVHRHPHMDILEIGTGIGATAKIIFDEIGSTFSSFTLTDVSSGFLDSAKSWAEPYLHKMILKAFDISQDPIAQGFQEKSYDVVVASLVLHTTLVVEQTLQNLRRLLKPGGYLVVLELLPTKSAVYGVIFGAFPGRWLGMDENRILLPAWNLVEWDVMLRRNGFSGCDTTTSELDEQNCITHFSLFVSQALDDKITFLRHPLSSASLDLFSPGTLIHNLVIVGGNNLRTIRLVEQTKHLVHRHCESIRTIRTLSELSSATISSSTAVLSFADLDGQMFQHLDNAQWEALKEMLMTAGTLVWVTQGRRADNPFANMMIGLMRSIIREVPTLSYQILDIEDSRNIDACTLAEAFLRFQAEILWRRQDSIPTTIETELVLDKGGRVMIPRLVTSEEMNKRYNSSKRSVVIHFDPHVRNICVAPSNTILGYELRQERVHSLKNKPDQVQIGVTHSLLSAVRIAEFGCMFVMLGIEKESGNQLAALATKNSSIVYPLDNLFVKVETQHAFKAKLLSLIAYNLLASVILRRLCKDDIVLVYEPDFEFAVILAKEARRIGLHITFVTTRVAPENPGWLQVHHSTTDRALSRLLPPRISVFVDFAAQTQNETIRNRIQSQLPTHCRRDNLTTLFANNAWIPPSSRVGEIYECLYQAVTRATCVAEETNEIDYNIPPVIPASSLMEFGIKPAPYSIIDWSGDSSIPVQIRPIDTYITFTNQKTYWLAGLSGGLGLSLCEWMFRHGAKFFVISSRRPIVDPSWLKRMQELGAVVKISACDVTIRDDVVALHAEICSSMPSIAGVAQGAMVMNDASIRDMTLDTFLESTRPKVEGSIYLNDLFQKNTLDFFVFFSSVVSVIGRPGQANYTAANMFMCSLAEQRRQRGLAASVIHIGPIYGVGYVAQQDRVLFNKAKMRSSALVPTSERDFYQLFAEAVIAGRPDSTWSSIEIFNGARRVSPHDPDQPMWGTDSLMSHFISNPEGLAPATADIQSRVPLKTQLTQARNRSEVYDIIQDTLFPKICTLFQLDSNKVSKGSLVGMRLNEMGIDSLLAVEIRGWFMKTLEVNIPVLKILGGGPIGDLITMATETIPERLVPSLEDNQRKELKDNVSNVSTSQDLVRDSRIYNSSTSDSNDWTKVSFVASDFEPINILAPVVEPSSPALQKSFRLSFSQEMFWFVQAFLKDKTSLNHIAWARLSGEIRLLDFQSAIRSLAQQHESLRTCIIERDGKPMQSIMKSSFLQLEMAQIDEEEEVYKAARSLQNHHVFDLARGKTIRIILLSRSPTEHFFVAGLHPLIADGLSFQSLLKGVQDLYMYSNNDQTLKKRQFSDYSEKQHAEFAAGKFESDLKFWRAEFATLPPPLPILTLSKATSRPALTAYENERAILSVSAETKEQIQAVCRRYRVTPFHFYLAVFRVLLLRYAPISDAEDVAIGIGDSNRTEDEMMDIIGPFVNLLPLRLRTQGSAKFTDLLQSTRDKAYAALAHSKSPFQVLLNELDVSRSASYTSLFQCFANYRQGLRETTSWGDGVTLHSVEIGISRMPYDITLEMVDYEGSECLQTLLVRKDLYGQFEAQRLAKSYERLMKAFIANPSSLLVQPDLFEPAEIQEVVKFSRGPSWPSQWPETLVHRIDQVTQMRPHDIAVRYGNKISTYAEISAHANAIAAALQAANLAPGSPVAVLQEPHPAWIASLLGIMRVGAVYLPLDLGLPLARLAAIIQDCRPPVVLVDNSSLPSVSQLKRPEMQVIDVSNVGRHSQPIPVSAILTADATAAILYTSGSSGAPKGILVKHQGLRNWTEPITHLYNLSSEVVLQQTTPTFDLSLVQIFTALCFGGSLVILSRQERGDALVISKTIAREGVTFTCATPSEYATWIHYGKQELCSSAMWRTAFCIGEPVPISLQEQLISLGATDFAFYNLYGPTETSLASTSMQVPLKTSCEPGPIAAGRPLPNYSVYVVDGQLRPVPSGVQGEIYIGGACVGAGYLNNPELTAARFVPDVFAMPEDIAKCWTTLHRTGDLGRWREDGSLLIEGRISGDTQVKLRGLRLDLAEVEHAIIDMADGLVRSAAVSIRSSSLEKPKFLVAHVIFDQEVARRDSDTGLEQHISTIQSRLSKVLPQYMCPAAILSLDRMPVTSSGKLDRKTVAMLPLPERTRRIVDGEEKNYVLSETEIRLRSIWEQILSQQITGLHRRITAETDFFHAGGSSLLLLSLQARIKDEFNVNIPLIRMFESSVLSTMASRIDHGKQQEVKAINWDNETALSPPLLELPPTQASCKNDPKVVVLTGATGQLGRGLLDALVADSNVKHVHCIGVRNVQTRQKDIAAVSLDKITLHEGDLVLPRLGMSESDAKRIFGDAEAIIHNGADMSYLKTYSSLRTVNLQSTKELVEMSARYGGGISVPFHYISTVSVGNIVTAALHNRSKNLREINSPKQGLKKVDDFVLHPVSVAAYPPPSTVSSSDMAKMAHGYIASKWASEVFLERLNERYPAWPIVIHRPSFIVRQGMENALGLEFLENLRHYTSLIRAVPVIRDGWRVTGILDMVPLAVVVKGVMDILMKRGEGAEDSAQTKKVRFLHHIGGEELRVDDLRGWVVEEEKKEDKGGETRGDIREMDVVEWARKAGSLGMSPTMVAMLEDFAVANGQITFPQLANV